jgi:prenyltransferase beta subunit
VHEILIEKIVPVVMNCGNDVCLITGSSGCLYALLMLYHKVYEANDNSENQTCEIILDYIYTLTKKIAKICIKSDKITITSESKKQKVVESSKKRKIIPCFEVKSGHLGAMHGTVGVLYMVIQAIKVVKKLRSDKELMAAVEQTLKNIVSEMKNNEGYLPSKMGDKSHKI